MSECNPDYLNLGMQAGEEVATTLRLVALCFSLSILFPWLCPVRRSRMRIFFLHWASGVMYVLSQFIMSVMVLNCWSSRRHSGPVIFVLKFWELASLNLWSISSLAIAILIASIVQSFAQCRRVPTMIGSPKAAYMCVAASIAATTLSAAFWNSLIVTGGYFWVTNTDSMGQSRWISLSFGATQTMAGILMAVAVIFASTGSRLKSLRICCKSSKRVYFHFILTIFGTCVYVYNGIVLLIDEFSGFEISRRLVIIGWCSRYAHVIADTAIIFGAFKVLEKADCVEEDVGRQAGQRFRADRCYRTGVSSNAERDESGEIVSRPGGSTSYANTTSGEPTIVFTPLPRPAGVNGSGTTGKVLANAHIFNPDSGNKANGHPTKCIWQQQQQVAPSPGLTPKAASNGSFNASSNASSNVSSVNGQMDNGRRPTAKE